jgi:hypothetical protein
MLLGGNSIPLILEVARSFKDTAPVGGVEMQGFVTRLARGPQERSGEVTLGGLIDGQRRRAAVEFGEGIYSQAVAGMCQESCRPLRRPWPPLRAAARQLPVGGGVIHPL